ncbi:hypothetical protein NQ315_012919 [Exocentrus adspersus]|uniref:Retrotransposon gag domain-containing protein n=1 Tax=Exocentrus adspersus TaxID=1586481 RepID=A0AAV8VSI7_9CUCU|nr:hypothetical protein NQ315_012919 [Exocentrus adspersus]
MATGEEDDVVIGLDEAEREFLRSPGQDNASASTSSRGVRADPASVEVGNLVKALMDSGLMDTVRRVARQQATLTINDLSETTSQRVGDPMVVVHGQAGTSSGSRTLLVGSDVLDYFDPDDADANIERWLYKVDSLRKVHGWSDYEKSTLVQRRLEGSARRWFHQLDSFDLSWDQWKVKLMKAFLRRRDFAVMVEELVDRRKLATETMSTYYHAKLALCDRINIKGADAVSMIIRGLPEGLRANAYAAGCASPEELYNDFLAGLEN